MKKPLAVSIVSFLLLLLCSFSAHSIPGTISYQGLLTDGTGAVLSGDYSITFRLFDAETDGTQVWSEIQTVTVSGGIYNVQLGSAASFGEDVDFTVPYWLEVAVGDETLSPRQELTSVPYAMHAQYADEVSSNSIINLEIATDSTSTAAVKGVNTGNGYGLYGWSASNYGVYGYTPSGIGVSGYSNDGVAIQGLNGSIGNTGSLGTPEYGVYGKAYSGYAGYFDGDLKTTGAVHAAGNVGIGTDNPTLPLYIQQTVAGLAYPLKVENHAAGDAPGESDVGILFSTGGSGSNDRGKGAIAYQTTGTWNRGSFHILQDTGANSYNPDLADSVLTITNIGDVGIGTTEPESLLHVSAGTAGDAQLTLEADTDNNDEMDQPSVLFKQDGGTVFGRVGYEEGNNNLRIRASEKIQFVVWDEFNKDVLVATMDENGITHPAKTGYLTLPASSFTPRSHSTEYFNWGNALGVSSLVFSETDQFYASVMLPDNAVITRMVAYFTDESTDYAELRLRRHNNSNGDDTAIATCRSSSLNGYGPATDEGITEPVVSNLSYTYFIRLDLPNGVNGPMWFHLVRIEYTYTD